MKSRIDILLVAGLTTMMGGVLLSFTLLSTQSQLRRELLNTVEQAGDLTLNTVRQKVRAAKDVEATPTKLMLTMEDPGSNPTIIELEDGRIRITEGKNVSYLTPETAQVQNLNFALVGEAVERSDAVKLSFEVRGKAEGTMIPTPEVEQPFEETITAKDVQ